VKRILFVLLAGVSLGISYLTVIQGLGAHPGLGAVTVASIALPALVAGLLMVAYIAWDVGSERGKRSEASTLGAVLVKKEIEIDRLATVDELTGLETRHTFLENVELEYARAVRYRRPMALLLVEIDDTEALGEQARKLSKTYLLSEVAAVLRAQLRANDLGGRYMSEVLGVLLPETNAAQAEAVADRMRTSLSTREFFGRRFGVEIGLTVSQGIVAAPAGGVTSAEEFLRAGDTALQAARSAGSGQVYVYRPPAEEPAEEERLAS
jgi:diguanylate cyclase (GGDEF)-like protein